MTDLGLTLRSALAALFVHTYTRTAISQGTEDTWGDTADTPGTPAAGLPCVLVWEQRLRIDDTGRVMIQTPALYVPYDDPLAVGDRVSSVADASGTVTLAGPLVVDSIDPAAELGSSACKIAVLRAGTVVE